MKSFLSLMLILVSMPVFANENNQNSSSNNTNSNNTIVVKPEIRVDACCASSCEKKDRACPLTRTVVKKVVVEKIVKETVEKKVYKKNRISLLGGVGPTGINQPTNTEVDLVRGAIGGAMYQRNLNESWNLGIQLQTNQTVLGSVGYDF